MISGRSSGRSSSKCTFCKWRPSTWRAKIVEYTDFRLHFLTFLPYFMIVSLFVSFLILVKFDVEDFPLANADAGVTALVSLVAVMATQVLHGAIVSNSDLING